MRSPSIAHNLFWRAAGSATLPRLLSVYTAARHYLASIYEYMYHDVPEWDFFELS